MDTAIKKQNPGEILLCGSKVEIPSARPKQEGRRSTVKNCGAGVVLVGWVTERSMWMVREGAVCAEMTNEVLMVSGGARDC